MTSVRRALYPLRDLAFCLVDWCAVRWVRSRRSGATMHVRLDGIGDFVLWLDAITRLLQSPVGRGGEQVLVCDRAVRDLAVDLQLFDRVISVETARLRRDIPYRVRFLRQIASNGFAVAIHSTLSRSFLMGDSVVRASRADHRIGSSGDLSNIRPWQKRLSDRWYTRLVSASPAPMMELERNAEFVSQVTGQTIPACVPVLPPLAVDLSKYALPSSYFVVFPGASTHRKAWPPTRFADVARAIVDRTGWGIVLCGTASDAAAVDGVRQHGLGDAIDLTGRTSLSELVEILRGAQLLLTNDTAAVHAAAAVQTASIAILGGGHFGRFLPYPEAVEGTKPVAVYAPMACYSCGLHCVWPLAAADPYPCVSGVSVKAVQHAVDALLAERCGLPPVHRRDGDPILPS